MADTQSPYTISFYGYVSDGELQVSPQGDPVVNIAFGTNINKLMRFRAANFSGDVFVFYQENINMSRYKKFLVNIEELMVSKNCYKMKPLMTMLKSKVRQSGFTPYILKREKPNRFT
jgi:hypothetical protein